MPCFNLKNKTYSVMTCEQMVQAMDQMAKKAAAQTDNKKAEMNLPASVKEIGQTKVISGLNTREVILTLVMKGTAKESGDKGSLNAISNMWMAPDVPGYGEVRAFRERMAAKLTWTPGSSAYTQGRGDMSKAFADLSKESAKLQGVPVLQVVSMGGAAEGLPASTSAPGALLELTTETIDFSGGPADESRFEVPTGFKRVQNELVKALK